MLRETTCDCAICSIEARLFQSLAVTEGAIFADLPESYQRLRYSSISDVLSDLRASPANARSDELLSELFKIRTVQPAFIESLLVLAFVPMLHGTIRRVMKYQPGLAGEDVTQQALRYLLQFLRSAEMQNRQSHFAFAISRAVKRQVFEWARREGTNENALNSLDGFLLPAVGDPFERYAQLRHFLHRCVMKGLLTDSELDLLNQFKLEETNGAHSENSDTIRSNAVRQRLKRLLAKLRRLAQ